MQKIILPVFFLLATFVLPAQTQTNTSVFFETDRYELSPEARQSLDLLTFQLLIAPDYAVSIEAWTDDQGSDEYNLRLAANRADAVKQYLAAKGLVLSKTTVHSWGEQNLEYDNTSEQNRQLNRRVDVAVNSIFFRDYSALQDRLNDNTEQVLSIRPDQPQTLVTAKGTQILVPSGSFVFEDGSAPQGPVVLTVREAFSPEDFILHNLTTTSDGKILQTGGMVYIGAESEGRPLQLAGGAALTVALPTAKVDPGMELFYGEPTADNKINWKPAGQKFRQTLEDPRVTLDIDPLLGKRIMSIQVPASKQPTMPDFDGPMPPAPRKPVAPYKPRAPQKPDWTSIQKMFGGGSGEPLRKKDAKKADHYYRTAQAKFQRDSVEYERLLQRFLQNEANYVAAKARFAADRQKWNDELTERIRVIMAYEEEEYLYEYSVALQLAVKRIGKNIQRYENYSNLEHAVHNAAIDYYLMTQKERYNQRGSDQIPISGLYDKFIGFGITEGADFRSMLNSSRQAGLMRNNRQTVAKMLASTGVREISDSLKSEIRARRMLLVQSPHQADREIRAYVADVTRLGWINCDRFYNDPGEKVQMVVKEQEDATMYLLCRDINSLLAFYRDAQGNYVANGLPKGQKVSVISIKLKDGVPYLALHDTKAGESGDLKMDYRSLSLRDLRDELKKLNI